MAKKKKIERHPNFIYSQQPVNGIFDSVTFDLS